MVKRKLGKTGLEVSALGFGCMRLPVIDGDLSKIDEEKAIPMVRAAIDKGVNYLDTAYPYHGGSSESFVGKVIKDGYKDKVVLATKMPSWLCKSYEDFERIFEEQLERLGVEKIDLYLMHNLDGNMWENMKNIGVFDFLNKIKREGKVSHVGFSFHDSVTAFKKIVDEYDWEFCQIQMNYMDREIQATLEGMKYAADKGLGIVIMEPLKGGQLAKEPPESIKAIWDRAEIKRTPAEWGLRYLYNMKEVSVILSGMNTYEQLEENIETANNSPIGCLTEKENSIIDEVCTEYKKLIKIPCTACQYCMPCPFGVEIPKNFEYYNNRYMHDAFKFYKTFYNRVAFNSERALNCKACGVCIEKCPQRIDIPTEMKKIAEEFME